VGQVKNDGRTHHVEVTTEIRQVPASKKRREKKLGQPNAPTPHFRPIVPNEGSVKAGPLARSTLADATLRKTNKPPPEREATVITKRLADGRMITAPTLPASLIAHQGAIKIEHFYFGNDHPPAHVHIVGGGHPTAVGMMGKVIANHTPLTHEQRAVVEAHQQEIRRAVKKIARWLWFMEQ
jgi:hypothetical protein